MWEFNPSILYDIEIGYLPEVHIEPDPFTQDVPIPEEDFYSTRSNGPQANDPNFNGISLQEALQCEFLKKRFLLEVLCLQTAVT